MKDLQMASFFLKIKLKNIGISRYWFVHRWEAKGWPHKIEQQMERTNDVLNEDRERFKKLQVSDALNFEERIASAAVRVSCSLIPLSFYFLFLQTHDKTQSYYHSNNLENTSKHLVVFITGIFGTQISVGLGWNKVQTLCL